MASIGWILIVGFILFVLLLVAKDEYYDRREKQRRVELRAEIAWPVLIRTDAGAVEGKTLNISAGGALFRCLKQFSQNEIISLTIRPPVRPPMEITAEVVRTSVHLDGDQSSPQGTAVRFIIVSEKDRQFLSFSVFDHSKIEKTSSR
jgi:hypothetical protein